MRLADFASSAKATLVLTIAAGGLVFSAGAALAEIRETTISQSTFESRCTSMGGTLDTGGTAQIKICKLPGGAQVACDFSTSPALCDISRMQPSIKDMLGPTPKSMTPTPVKPGVKLDTGSPSSVN
ncbi:MAG: hypothetical protein EOP22_08905 [Hyphomicrobiales bacterium]|nr:MAG: hypothetical protein EOP22_08905 [Hyphomicrobiales bacterium]